MPYLTVEEMHNNKKVIITDDRWPERGGTRFTGSTEPNLALKLFSKEERILDCGSLFGMFTKVLQDHGFTHIHALDFVDVMKLSDPHNVTFHEVDFNKDIFPYPDQYFDGVTAWGVMEHMENPYHFGREVHRVLKNDHYFIMALPSLFHFWSRLVFFATGMFPRWNHRNNHISIFPHGVFEKIFLRYFTLEQTIYTKPSLRLNTFNWTSKYLPANQWLGNYVIYVLKRKEFIPFIPKKRK